MSWSSSSTGYSPNNPPSDVSAAGTPTPGRILGNITVFRILIGSVRFFTLFCSKSTNKIWYNSLKIKNKIYFLTKPSVFYIFSSYIKFLLNNLMRYILYSLVRIWRNLTKKDSFMQCFGSVFIEPRSSQNSQSGSGPRRPLNPYPDPT